MVFQPLFVACAVKLGVYEPDVKRSVVYDEFSAIHIVEKILHDVSKPRLVGQKLVGDTVYLNSTFIDMPVRLQVFMEIVSRDLSSGHLDTTDLDYSVPITVLQAGSFCIQYYLSHYSSCQNLPDVSVS